MPVPPKIPHTRVIEILAGIDGLIDEQGDVPGPRQDVWKIAAKKLDNIYSPDYIHLFLKQNRHGAYEAYCAARKIEPAPKQSRSSNAAADDSNSDPVGPMTTFHIIIPPEIWSSIQPVDRIQYRRKV